MHTQLSLYDYVSGITVPMSRYITGYFYFEGIKPRNSRKNNGLWKSINTGFSGSLFSCFFCCPNAGSGFEDKYFMQKGREENECKKQKMFSKDSCIAEAEAEP